MNAPTLMINEIFHSLQGEGTRMGRPCTFVRLTGCHLRCIYCDTEYAFHEGRRMTLDEIIEQVEKLTPSGLRSQDSRLIELTGGEPLLQPAVHPLMTRLADAGWTVLIETGGACDISACDRRIIRIVDFKTPGSGECHRNDWANVDRLNERDEVKFVLTDRADYEWARQAIGEHDLPRRVAAVLFSPVQPVPRGEELPGSDGLPLRDLARWVLEDGLDVVVQIQLHKLIWDPQARGV